MHEIDLGIQVCCKMHQPVKQALCLTCMPCVHASIVSSAAAGQGCKLLQGKELMPSLEHPVTYDRSENCSRAEGGSVNCSGYLVNRHGLLECRRQHVSGPCGSLANLKRYRQNNRRSLRILDHAATTKASNCALKVHKNLFQIQL